MDIIPAVDIMGGKVVRLSKGEPDTAKKYKDLEEPLLTARRWESEGANYLHVIDLDAAIGGRNNRQIVLSIIQGVNIPVQVGGGIRSRSLAEEILNIGASRIIMATLAFKEEDAVKILIEDFGSERVMVALDYLNGIVMTHGWKDSTGLALDKALEKFSNLGVYLFLLTSISRDGLLIGSDYKTLKAITKRSERKIFIAGGINSLNDLVRLNSIDINGVVIGKALYEGRFTLREALDAVRE